MRGHGTRNIMVKTPDRWSIVEIEYEGKTTWKVLGSWYGGYGGGDSWQLSSGIVETKETDNGFEFTNESGSVYVCYNNSYGMSGYTSGIYSYWQKQIEEEGNTMSLRLLEENEVKGML